MAILRVAAAAASSTAGGGRSVIFLLVATVDCATGFPGKKEEEQEDEKALELLGAFPDSVTGTVAVDLFPCLQLPALTGQKADGAFTSCCCCC